MTFMLLYMQFGLLKVGQRERERKREDVDREIK